MERNGRTGIPVFVQKRGMSFFSQEFLVNIGQVGIGNYYIGRNKGAVFQLYAGCFVAFGDDAGNRSFTPRSAAFFWRASTTLNIPPRAPREPCVISAAGSIENKAGAVKGFCPT
jgi:hypothetical protein